MVFSSDQPAILHRHSQIGKSINQQKGRGNGNRSYNSVEVRGRDRGMRTTKTGESDVDRQVPNVVSILHFFGIEFRRLTLLSQCKWFCIRFVTPEPEACAIFILLLFVFSVSINVKELFLPGSNASDLGILEKTFG